MTMTSSWSVEGALQSAVADHIDEDTLEYIRSLLEENPSDEDARDSVREMIVSATEPEGKDGVGIVNSLFELLDLGTDGNLADDDDGATGGLRKLDQAVTMQSQDIRTFASGLRANEADLNPLSHDQPTQIAAFYANMIDPNASEEALSERVRRKARQKEMRMAQEEEERQRAIQQAMAVLEEKTAHGEALMEKAQADNMQDVHLADFDLPNLRGGGPNLLQNTNLTLSRGRRYGLMGRNGCGKTTFLTFLAQRKILNAVPKSMNMLLVRQEVIGNQWTAVETVLKSDVQRESIKRYIAFVETELEKLDNPEDTHEEEQEKSSAAAAAAAAASSKGRQKMRDRKKQQRLKAAKKAATSSNEVKQTKEERRAGLNQNLVAAHQRLGEIEAEEGGDPEPRAQKVLSGLGFSKEMQDKPTEELSGGWRMRVSLSCALFANPSLLLLGKWKHIYS